MNMLQKREDSIDVQPSIEDTTTTGNEPTPTTSYYIPPSFAPIYTGSTSNAAIYGNTPINLPSFAPISEATIGTTDSGYITTSLLSFAPITQTVDGPFSTSSSTVKNIQSSPATVRRFSCGQIAGIIVGGVTGISLIAYLLYVLCWSRKKALKEAKEAKEERKRNQGRGHTFVQPGYNVQELDFDNELFGDDNNSEKNDSPSTLPRQGHYYDPKRRYFASSIMKDPKAEFRSYYKHVVPLYSSSSDGSQYSTRSDTPLYANNTRSPFYDGFSPLHYSPQDQMILVNSIQLFAPQHGLMNYYQQPGYCPPHQQ